LVGIDLFEALNSWRLSLVIKTCLTNGDECTDNLHQHIFLLSMLRP
jgi:hypothetical protein